jgi:hypothetical protein
MVSKKTKRHSGRYTPRLSSKINYEEMKKDALEPQEDYDDWVERRDGQRDVGCLERKKKEKGKFPYKRFGRGRTQGRYK